MELIDRQEAFHVRSALYLLILRNSKADRRPFQKQTGGVLPVSEYI